MGALSFKLDIPGKYWKASTKKERHINCWQRNSDVWVNSTNICLNKVFSSLLKNHRNLPPSPTSNLKLTCKLHTTLIHSLSKSPKDLPGNLAKQGSNRSHCAWLLPFKIHAISDWFSDSPNPSWSSASLLWKGLFLPIRHLDSLLELGTDPQIPSWATPSGERF